MLQDSAAAWFAAHVGGGRTPQSRGREPDADEWSSFARLGWLAVGLPEEFGGFGGGPIDAMILMEAFGRAGILEPFMSTAVVGARAIVRFGSTELRRTLLPLVAQGDLRLGIALYEDPGGCMPEVISTRAVPCDGGFALHGQKPCVLDAASADKLLVAARVAHEEGKFSGSSWSITRRPDSARGPSSGSMAATPVTFASPTFASAGTTGSARNTRAMKSSSISPTRRLQRCAPRPWVPCRRCMTRPWIT